MERPTDLILAKLRAAGCSSCIPQLTHSLTLPPSLSLSLPPSVPSSFSLPSLSPSLSPSSSFLHSLPPTLPFLPLSSLPSSIPPSFSAEGRQPQSQYLRSLSPSHPPLVPLSFPPSPSSILETYGSVRQQPARLIGQRFPPSAGVQPPAVSRFSQNCRLGAFRSACNSRGHVVAI